MNSIIAKEKLAPTAYLDILGCRGFDNTTDIVCMTANGDNNFLNEGIVEGSLLFIDTSKTFEEGLLHVFKFDEETNPQYKLSRTKIDGATHYGKLMVALNQYR